MESRNQQPNQSPEPTAVGAGCHRAAGSAVAVHAVCFRVPELWAIGSNPNDWATVTGSRMTNLLATPIVTTNLDKYNRLVYP